MNQSARSVLNIIFTYIFHFVSFLRIHFKEKYVKYAILITYFFTRVYIAKISNNQIIVLYGKEHRIVLRTYNLGALRYYILEDV